MALIIVIGSLLTVAAIVTTAYQALVQDFEDLLTQRQILEAKRTSEQVDQRLQLRLNALSAFAAQLASTEQLPDPVDLAAALGRQTTLRDLLPAGLLAFDEKARAVAENIYVPDRVGTQYLDRPHFQEALQSRRPVVSKPIIGRTTGKPLLSFLAPIETDDNDLLGFVGGILDLSETSLLSGHRQSDRQPSQSIERIIDTANFLYVDSGQGSRRLEPLPPPGADPLTDAALSGITFGQVEDHQGQTLIYATNHLQRLGWVFVRAVPYEQATTPARQSFFRFFSISLLITLGLAILSYLLARSTMLPLDRMTSRIQRMAEHPDSAMRLRETGLPELKSLAGAFNRLLEERDNLARLKDNFMSSVSHELRTPLTSMTGALKLLSSGTTGPLNDQSQAMANLALRNADRLQLLISDLLDFNKLSDGSLKVHIQSEPLQPILDAAIADNATMAAEHGVRLESETGVSVNLLCDKHRMRQVLDNFLSNAIKYSPEGGTVRVTAEQHSPERVRVTVSDQGSGVPDSFSNSVFKRFSQAETGTARSVKGTGLGLAISDELAKLMHGGVGYYNNQGAHFWIEVPVSGNTGSPA
ncbi:two-component sensor histidine kinase [Marinobacter vulgaris]|uniref:histidine kinase n=1 Tax=Marinobacter vulgaris TaxID=1928331 RepID=A0A2V3ZR75_9GAMM|nr:ATP-binding protein [Marinobacter vulgaris]PXX93839.1 two-component sensor histidine kinase [Marinobacter vulgaris]TSJ72781.1 HAMP domain-containing histidine kinase [Marinobacter vulgaris]